ncbi:hypothetical protein Golax_004217 [Gossypium laxum]|uniref:COI1 F-box domain-containing protein n=1 Tax=Gossypium laxum TaxID=34288 RepID=A0A7J9AHT7_9ROSI|nr:hypothetical protein [Gossypium laxum]
MGETGLSDVVLGLVMMCVDDPKDRDAISLVSGADLEVLAKSRGRALQALKLGKCCGFSTDGLLHVGRVQLRILFLEESSIIEKDGQWLHEIAINISFLDTLNFYMTNLVRVSFEDLELTVRNCLYLASVKVRDSENLDLVGFFRAASVLEEFCGSSVNEEPEMHAAVSFPPRLCCLGITYIRNNELPVVFPFASLLKKLDLIYALLNTEDHCLLIQRCPNLEALKYKKYI